jgi:hypothetical protein
MLLPDGRVLAAGGEPSTSPNGTPDTAQIYSPPYLFKGPRPTISDSPDSVSYGDVFGVSTPNVNDVTRVALIRPSSVTHANNMDQRYVPLYFVRSGGELLVNAPANGNWAPPGWYMLVIQNSKGVPSESWWIHVGGTGYEPGGGPAPGGGPTPSAPPPPPPPSSLELRVSDAKAKEGKKGKSKDLSFTVSLSAKAKSTITVKYATADDTAIGGSDYKAVTGKTLKIKSGKKSAKITVKTIGDAVREPDETFGIVVSDASGATIADAEGTGTITNDD